MSEERKELLSMTAETIGKDILGAMVQEMKLLPDVWPKMSEKKQNDVIDRLRKLVEHNVKMAVHLIASNGRTVVLGDLESITIKDGTKATIKFSQSAANIVSLYESTGEAVMVIVGTAAQHTGGMNEIKGESDQRTMDLGKEYKPDSDGDGMDDSNVIDAEIKELQPPQAPEFTEEELIAMYQAGRDAAAEGLSEKDCPRISAELVKQWMRGFADWHEENPKGEAA